MIVIVANKSMIVGICSAVYSTKFERTFVVAIPVFVNRVLKSTETPSIEVLIPLFHLVIACLYSVELTRAPAGEFDVLPLTGSLDNFATLTASESVSISTANFLNSDFSEFDKEAILLPSSSSLALFVLSLFSRYIIID